MNRQKNFALSDYELAKQDLINYLNIRRGEKLMQPNFGTIIWDQLFEPLNDETQQAIANDVRRIVAYDPRLQATQIGIIPRQDGILVQLTLAYVPSDQTETIMLNFNRESQTLTTGIQQIYK